MILKFTWSSLPTDSAEPGGDEVRGLDMKLKTQDILGQRIREN